METLWQDIRYGARMLLKNRGLALIAILTLALGIGANTAIFTLVNAILLRDLPYPQPDQLVVVNHSYPGINLPRAAVSPAGYLHYRRVAKSYSYLTAFTGHRTPQNLTGAGQPDRVRCIAVSWEFFPALGIYPSIGRAFQADEDQPGKNRVAVLSHSLWKQRFGGDAQIVGKEIKLDGAAYLILGVMPAGFGYPQSAEVWIPIAFTPEQQEQLSEYLTVIGRLGDGVTPAQAQAELDLIAADVRKRMAAFFAGDTSGWHIVQDSLRELTVGDLRPALLILLGAVTFVLLIACANLAHLLLARAMTREKEFAIRLALGSGRFRLVRQLLTECVLLALVGGGAGVLLAFWGLDAMLRFAPIDLPNFAVVQIDGRVLVFTALLSVLTGILFGLLPAMQMTRGHLSETLKEGGRAASISMGRRPLRAVLVAGEVSLALMLLIGAGLMLRSFARLQDKDPGFDPKGVMTLRLSLPQGKYAQGSQRWLFYERTIERLASLPGVGKVGATSSLPLVFGSSASFEIEGKQIRPAPHCFSASVSPDYFQAMRIELLRGRAFESRDAQGTTPVAIVDDKAVAMYWPNEDPIGKKISYFSERDGEKRVWREIVGVVRGVKHTAALAQESKGQVYVPLAQVPSRSISLAVRSAGNISTLASAARAEVLALDPEQPIYDIKTMETLLSDYVAQPRFNMLLLGFFAALSLLLAAAGIYGVISHSVAQRTHEIGIRMALGAESRQILQMIFSQGILLAGAGVTAGLAGAFALSRFLESQLFEISSKDPGTFVMVPCLLIVVALLACWIPARRATRVDPMVALRYE